MARRAFVVGTGKYLHPGLRGLDAPVTDVRELVRVLGDPEVGAFDLESVVDNDAATVRQRLEAFYLTDISHDDVLLVYFSGHGLKDASGRLYFAASDTDPALLLSTAIPATFLQELMNATRARQQVLILDCCYAGAFPKGMVAKSGSAGVVDELGGGRGRVILSSSDALEYSFEDIGETSIPRSVFTCAIVEGLESGRADTNADGVITAEELFDYAADEVRARSAHQSPRRWSFDVERPIVIARAPQAVPDDVHPLVVEICGVRSELSADRSYLIGRSHDVSLRIDDQGVSRHHAELLYEQGRWLIRDAGSRNGIFIDGMRVRERMIQGTVVANLGHPDHGVAIVLSDDASRGSSGMTVGTLASVRYAAAKLIRIGRDEDNDIVLNDVLVSRHHAELRMQAAPPHFVVDLGSHNGTFLNGARIAEHELFERDIITIGRHQFRVLGDRLEQYVDDGRVAFAAIGLSVRAPSGATLLDDVSLELGGSSLMAVVGPSGSGKSTLLGAMTGMRPAQEGVVLYDGRDLYARYDELRERIGYVPQDDVLHVELRVVDALRFTARLRFPPDTNDDEIDVRVDQVMLELGLRERSRQRVRELSGGQRKRVSVALELLTKPSLLFLDEPTSGLDPGLERSVMLLLRELADGARTVIVVTHALQSLEVCDRVVFLAPGGRLAYFGPPGRMLDFFRCDDVADVFERVENDAAADWNAQYRQSELAARYLTDLTNAVVPVSRAVESHVPEQPTTNRRRQFTTLLQRNIAVLLADRRQLALLALQAPVLGLLLMVALEPDSLTARPVPNLNSRPFLVALILTAIWIGASNSIREIVRERAVFGRERARGVSPLAYLASKIVLLGSICAVQAIVLFLVATARLDDFGPGAFFPSARFELMVVVVLSSLTAMSMGLLISALVSTTSRAVSILPLLLIPQLLLCGALMDVDHRPFLREVSYATISRYAFYASASTTDLNRLEFCNNDTLDAMLRARVLGIEPNCQPGRFSPDASRWLANVAALVLLATLADAGALLALSRGDAPWHRRRERRT